MLKMSNLNVLETFRKFKKHNIEIVFLVPTKTGLEKSIMDATQEIRDFFFSNKIHNYSKQHKGKNFKFFVDTILVSKDNIIKTKTSLYRPETKNGDPRLWIYNLKNYANPYDLLTLIINKNKLIIINCSQSNLEKLLSNENIFYKEYIENIGFKNSHIAEELKSKIKKIYKKGFINTLRSGDTGVGYTLETLLGIPANSSRNPDYKGIEIKAGRMRTKKSGRTTIFSQVPNWELSRLKSSKDILFERGKYNEKKKRHQLFHELVTTKTNSYNMRLELDPSIEVLYQIYIEDSFKEKDVLWNINHLKKRLIEKHHETFWVTAETIGKSGDDKEQFRYSSIKHTGNIDPNASPILLNEGIISLDYTIKEKKTGIAKDQGYLFKISSKNLDMLFLSVKEYKFN